jgi:hypothetical protein
VVLFTLLPPFFIKIAYYLWRRRLVTPKSGMNPVEERILAPQSEFKFPFLSLVP